MCQPSNKQHGLTRVYFSRRRGDEATPGQGCDIWTEEDSQTDLGLHLPQEIVGSAFICILDLDLYLVFSPLSYLCLPAQGNPNPRFRTFVQISLSTRQWESSTPRSERAHTDASFNLGHLTTCQTPPRWSRLPELSSWCSSRPPPILQHDLPLPGRLIILFSFPLSSRTARFALVLCLSIALFPARSECGNTKRVPPSPCLSRPVTLLHLVSRHCATTSIPFPHPYGYRTANPSSR